MRSNTRVGHYVFVVVVEDKIIVVVYDVQEEGKCG